MVSRQREMSTCLSRWGNVLQHHEVKHAAVVEPHTAASKVVQDLGQRLRREGLADVLLFPQAGEFVLPVHVAVGHVPDLDVTIAVSVGPQQHLGLLGIAVRTVVDRLGGRSQDRGRCRAFW